MVDPLQLHLAPASPDTIFLQTNALLAQPLIAMLVLQMLEHAQAAKRATT
jgi:hypothetical protein